VTLGVGPLDTLSKLACTPRRLFCAKSFSPSWDGFFWDQNR
jgi:hypothetical protein